MALSALVDEVGRVDGTWGSFPTSAMLGFCLQPLPVPPVPAGPPGAACTATWSSTTSPTPRPSLSWPISSSTPSPSSPWPRSSIPATTAPIPPTISSGCCTTRGCSCASTRRTSTGWREVSSLFPSPGAAPGVGGRGRSGEVHPGRLWLSPLPPRCIPAAGIPPDRLVEAHGTFATATCTVCQRNFPGEDFRVSGPSRASAQLTHGGTNYYRNDRSQRVLLPSGTRGLRRGPGLGSGVALRTRGGSEPL